MQIPIYQIDAFTDHLFGGNPAAVCILESPISDDLMQMIAMENNLSETVFLLKIKDRYNIRWFTPTIEVDLCGHATLASAHVLFEHLNFAGTTIKFDSKSGELSVFKENDLLTLNFPVDILTKKADNIDLNNAFSSKPIGCFKGRNDYLLVFENQTIVTNLVPNFEVIKRLDARGVIVTSKGDTHDFVSRFFAPQSGIDEDPVTGSAHTSLIPYWSSQLNKLEFHALQVSKRGGELWCKLLIDRVEISGKSVTYFKGYIEV